MTVTTWAPIRAALAVSVICLLAGVSLVACKGPQQDAKKAERELPQITPIEGMKYYVGGPVMKYDSYGRLRLGGFNGEVAAPVSRGLLIGYKLEPDGRHFEYRTWVNGRPVSKSLGFLDAQGLLWFSDRETYDSKGAVLARQTFTYDDTAKKMTAKVEQIDPKTGAVVHSNTDETPYTPPPQPADDEEDGDDEGGSHDNGK